jgi:hypothetical protein
MRKLASTIAIAAIAIAVTVSGAPAAQRTWVASTGLAGNTSATPPCNSTQPCDTFANALSVTDDMGEINCVDNSSYGTVTITKSVTIDCSGQLAALNVSGGSTAIKINGSNINVTLRNLHINGNGGIGNGIEVDNAASIAVESCVIENFSASGGAGLFVVPSQSLQFIITDSLIANNNDGMWFGPTAGGSVEFVVERVRLQNHLTAIIAEGASSSGTGVKGFVRDSVIAGSSNAGIFADTIPSGPTTVSVYRTHVVGNTIAIRSNASAAVLLSNSTVQANGTALSSTSGGAIFSYGNSPINGNQPGGIGTPPILIGLH